MSSEVSDLQPLYHISCDPATATKEDPNEFTKTGKYIKYPPTGNWYAANLIYSPITPSSPTVNIYFSHFKPAELLQKNAKKHGSPAAYPGAMILTNQELTEYIIIDGNHRLSQLIHTPPNELLASAASASGTPFIIPIHLCISTDVASYESFRNKFGDKLKVPLNATARSKLVTLSS